METGGDGNGRCREEKLASDLGGLRFLAARGQALPGRTRRFEGLVPHTRAALPMLPKALRSSFSQMIVPVFLSPFAPAKVRAGMVASFAGAKVLLSPFAPAKVRADMVASFAGAKGEFILNHALDVRSSDAHPEVDFDVELQIPCPDELSRTSPRRF
jgi:hypothetical protein